MGDRCGDFKNEKEMIDMVNSVKLSIPLFFYMFEDWKLNDGSRSGLQEILDKQQRTPPPDGE